MLLLLFFFLCLLTTGTQGTRCTAGQFNRNSGVREVTNDVGLAVLTVAGELRAVGSQPPAVVAAQQRAVLLEANRRAYASVFRPTTGSSGDTIVAWGDADYGADASGAAGAYKVERVVDIRATESGFAALISLKPPPVVEDAANVPRQLRAIAWGDGGNLPSRLASAQVESLHSTPQGFAATLPSGEIVTWGHCDTLGEAPSLVAVSPSDRPLTALAWAEAFCAGKKLEAAQLLALGGATSLREAWAPTLQSPPGAVAVAPGKTLWWWTTDSLLTPPSSAVNLRYRIGRTEATSRAFAAITEAGGVVAWGDAAKGGEVPGATAATVGARASRLFSNLEAFLVTTIDGGAFSWGDTGHGGGIGIASGVVDVASTETAFALLFRNSTVLVVGGDAALRRTWWVHDVKRIIGQRDTFAGVQRNGRIVTWGGIEASIKTVCQDCADDTWSNDDATQCLACDGGYWSSAGSAECQSCVLGICQRYVLGGMLGFASLILICCGVCMCDVADEQGF